MKPYLIALVILIHNLAFGSECSDLFKSFLQQEQKLKISIKLKDYNIEKYGLEDTPINRQKFERLYAQCISPDKNQIKNLASKNLSKISLGMSMSTTIVGYSNNNWDKPKDAEWFARLGYGLIFSYGCGEIYSKIIKDNGNRFHSIIKDYLFGRGATIAYTLGANVIFSSDKMEKEKIEKLKNSPTFQSDMKKLKEFFPSESFYDRYKKEVIAYLSNQDEISLGIGVHQGIDFDHLRPEDLKDPEVQDVVLAAIVSQEYENKNKMVSTGSSYGDFFLFDSIYSMARIPQEIFINQLTNKVMCLNLHNPKRGLTQAIGINVLNQIIFSNYYSITYKILKKEFTGE